MRAIIYLCLALLLVVIQLLYGPTTFFDYTPSTSYEINNEYTPDCCVRSWRNKTHQKHLRITIDRENNVVIPRDASEDCLVAQADMHIICLQPSVSFDLGYDRGRTSESGTFIMFNIKTFQGKTSSTGELTIGLLASGMNDYYLRVLSTAGGFTSLATSRVSVGLVQATLGIPTVVSTNETLDISVKVCLIMQNVA
ncbi:hypothetical protein SARC_03607 [Sphaeroforma arctica JP610]|uniref:Uncharacterized protein n=1 Tax=Sphaeroforma arctica JP610 TaxID=667725 RepID=A0A0L0G5Q2_9EUKA|nr:hypothetical protein SARC_03607 [Sphaeroforma arctica JP610]KNC84151.1 hypothetical protein SARC_03607 [Sphaeroforma arctica JP610]|eukprot:XP_014158053.1 hypothetical protein SARC_03607 [Sphaeroforma arctica JP610]